MRECTFSNVRDFARGTHYEVPASRARRVAFEEESLLVEECDAHGARKLAVAISVIAQTTGRVADEEGAGLVHRRVGVGVSRHVVPASGPRLAEVVLSRRAEDKQWHSCCPREALEPSTLFADRSGDGLGLLEAIHRLVGHDDERVARGGERREHSWHVCELHAPCVGVVAS